ncbi:MAG: hypothetical protein Q4F85_00185 [Prevotella sp.]|nr:hypothetical protein [Prevotella sp.]
MKKSITKVIQMAIFLAITLSACTNDERDLFNKVESPDAQQEKTFHSKVLNSENARTSYENLLDYFSKSQTRSESGGEYPDFYGGAFVDKNGKLVILYKSGDKNLLKVKSVQSILKSDSIRYVPCEFSFNELTSAIDAINNFHKVNPRNFNSENSTLYYISPAQNRVIVHLTEYNGVRVKEFKDNVIDSPVLVFKELSDKWEDVALAIRSGSKYYVGSSTTFGSFGYRAKKFGGNGFITSGHVISSGQIATTNNGSTTLGTCILSQVNNNVDAAYVSAASGVSPSNTIAIDGGTLSASTYNPIFGETVNLMGATTLGTSGLVTAINVSVYDIKTGVTTNDLIGVNCTSMSGDSGGIAYVTTTSGQNIPVGIIKSISGSNTYCVLASNINSILGVTMY